MDTVLNKKMKRKSYVVGLMVACCSLFAVNLYAQGNAVKSLPKGFIENKGQIIDQNNLANPEVKYLLSLPSMNVELKANSFSYDVYTTETKRVNAPGDILDITTDQQVLFHFHRIDIEFIGANPHPKLIANNRHSDVLNYYTTGTNESGIKGVSHFGQIVYKDLYPGIDLEFNALVGENKPVEYNFIVHPGADASQIQWRYKGLESDLENEKIVLYTRHGEVEEHIPHSFLLENMASLTVRYKKSAEGVFGFEQVNYDPTKTLVIDPLPSLQWSSYFGGSADDILYGVEADNAGNIFATGRSLSTSNIATSGVYQSTFGGGTGYGGGGDVVLLKFNNTGTLQWATYYGYSGHEQGQSIALDNAGNMYVQGTTASATGMGTTGSFQPNRGAGTYNDAFLAKFDKNGFRLWGTYYGANGNDRGSQNALNVDGDGNVYFGGTNNSANNTQVSSAGSFQATNGATAAYDEPFVAKFDSTGTRIWGTYYGGGGNFHNALFGMGITANGQVIVGGRTTSTRLPVSSGAFQSSYGGGSYDGFWGILDANGANLVYGTYIGGNGYDIVRSANADGNGNVVIAGFTESSNNIATAGAHQTSLSGSRDGMVMKFTLAGALSWGTYFGGSDLDDVFDTYTNSSGDIFLAGYSASSTGVATSGSFQTTPGGGNDGFVAKFDASGTQKWGTLFGGSGPDIIADIAYTSSGPLTIGYTESTSDIASSGSYQTTYGGNRDGFIAYFQDLQGQNNAGVNKVVRPSGYVCAGSQDIVIEVANSGLNRIDSVLVKWEINGVGQTDFMVTDTLAPGSTLDINLGSVSFVANNLMKIKAWTTLPNNASDTSNDNDTVAIEIKPGLDGVYTVGGTNPDYATIEDATADLNAFGVCGPVTFQLAAGTFNERLLLGKITGASASNTITFVGAGIGTTVLSSAGTSLTDMATVHFDGSDHVTLRDLSIENTGSSFGAGIWMNSSSDSNVLVNLNITVDSSSSSTNINGIILSASATAIGDGITGSSNRFDSLEINGGYYGIRLNGGGTSNNYALRNTISNASFFGQYRYGIFLRSQQEPIVHACIIQAPRFATSTALTFDYCASITASNNTLMSNDYGIHLNFVNANVYASNFSSRIFNNMVSSTADYALYCNGSSHINIWHNSFSSEPALAVARFASFQGIDFRNNHIENRNTAPGRYTLYADDASDFSALDYNNYFSLGGFVYLNSSNYANLPVLQAALSQYNQGSTSRDPLFNSTTDLHTSINLSGTYVGIDEDFDGDFRNTVAPVIGADEVNVPNNAGVAQILSPVPVFCAGTQDVRVRIGNYGVNRIDSVEIHWAIDGTNQGMLKVKTPIAIRGFKDTTIGTISFIAGDNKQIKIWTAAPNGVQDSLRNNDTLAKQVKTGLSGTYTIGANNADYSSFGEAIGDLSSLGVCSPVVFNVAAGTYNERLVVREVEGASAANTITFRGAGIGNTTLSYSGSNVQDWGTLNFEGGDHFVFKKMTVAAMGSNYGIGIILSAQSDSNTFQKMAVQTSPSSTSLNLVGIASLPSPTDLYSGNGPTGDGNHFDSMSVNGGYYGIYLMGTDKYVRISHSTFTDQYVSAVFTNGQEYIEIDHNVMSPLRNANFSYSLNLTMPNNFKVHGNTINAGGDYGVYMAFGNMFGADPNYNSSFYNNMVSNTSGYAFYADGAQEFSVFHNSFRSVGNSNSVDAAVDFNGCSMIEMQNNHIRNDNPNSYALLADGSTFDSLDYNNYYSFGDFVRIGGIFASLADLKNGLPQFNQNSFSQDPQFKGLTNLHTNAFIPGAYVGVNIDIDGEPRCPQTVSIGADDEDWGFAKPVITTNHMDFYTNYPVRFNQNIGTLPQMNFEWFIDGSYVTDSISFGTVFTGVGSYTVKLKANRCIHNDSAEFTINILSGNPVISILGNNPDSLRVFDSYVDLGATAVDVFGTSITTLNSGNTIDNTVLGSYYIWYTAEDAWGNKDSITRIVTVIDDVNPVLNLVGPDTLKIDVFAAINEPGANASDNYYSSVSIVIDSSQVNTSIVGLYPMTYTATDGSGNETSVVRLVKVSDNTLPTITLFGLDTVVVRVNYPYVEPGAKVADNYCKTGLSWEVDAYPNTSALGDYTLTYTASDCQNNDAIPVQRVVRVVDTESPIIYLNGLPVQKVQRWSNFNDPGVSMTDNYYSSSTLNDSLKIVSDVDMSWIGSYSVCYQVTDPSGNKSNQVCRVVEVVENTTSVQAGILEQVNVYPNPNKGIFQLDLGSNLGVDVRVELVDLAGKVIHQQLINDGVQHTELSIQNLASGTYVLRVYAKDAVASIKVTVQK